MTAPDHKPITEAELKEMEARLDTINFFDPDDDVTESMIEADERRLIAEVRRLRAIQRLDLDTIESVLMEYLVTDSEIERIMAGMADRLGGACYRGHMHLGPDDECSNTDCDALGPHARCFKDGRRLDDGSEM